MAQYDFHVADNAPAFHVAVYQADEEGQEAERVADFYGDCAVERAEAYVKFLNSESDASPESVFSRLAGCTCSVEENDEEPGQFIVWADSAEKGYGAGVAYSYEKEIAEFIAETLNARLQPTREFVRPEEWDSSDFDGLESRPIPGVDDAD